jgi:hypothetical protein
MKNENKNIIEYFHDDNMACARNWDISGVHKYEQYSVKEPKTLNPELQSKIDKINIIHFNKVDIKGRYNFFKYVLNDTCQLQQSQTNGDIFMHDATVMSFNESYLALQSDDKINMIRSSYPIQYECKETSQNIFNLSVNDTLESNQILWASEKPIEIKLYDLYLNAGLYDCYLIKSTCVPLHRLAESTKIMQNKKTIERYPFYKPARECIIKHDTKFKITKVEFGVISVCTLTGTTPIVESNTKTFWKRIIEMEEQPQIQQHPSHKNGGNTPKIKHKLKNITRELIQKRKMLAKYI